MRSINSRALVLAVGVLLACAVTASAKQGAKPEKPPEPTLARVHQVAEAAAPKLETPFNPNHIGTDTYTVQQVDPCVSEPGGYRCQMLAREEHQSEGSQPVIDCDLDPYVLLVRVERRPKHVHLQPNIGPVITKFRKGWVFVVFKGKVPGSGLMPC
jgi:hypothetical protein